MLMKHFAQGIKDIVTWLYCWLHDQGINPFGFFVVCWAVVLALHLPKRPPRTCEEQLQLNPKWVAALQQQPDYEAFLKTRGSTILCAAKLLQLMEQMDTTTLNYHLGQWKEE